MFEVFTVAISSLVKGISHDSCCCRFPTSYSVIRSVIPKVKHTYGRTRLPHMSLSYTYCALINHENYRLEVNSFHVTLTYALCYASVASSSVSRKDGYNHMPTHCAIQQARPTAISDEIITDVQGVAYSSFPCTQVKLNLNIHHSTDT